MIVLGGSDALGVHECINLLHEWMDPRGLEVNAMQEPSDEERERPRYWRYWRRLPAHGRVGLFTNEWTTRTIIKHLEDQLDRDGFDTGLSHARRFERMLANDGMVIVKLWIHISRKELRKRREKAIRKDDRPWSFSADDRRYFEHFDRSHDVVSYALRETHTENAPWQVIDGSNDRHRNACFVRAVLDALARYRDERPAQVVPRHGTIPVRQPPQSLDQVDLSLKLEKDDYQQRLRHAQRELLQLSREAQARGKSTILVMEGWDAAGKGGAIRRMMAATDAEHVRVIPVAKPTDEAYAHHYLWRFWRQLGRAGQLSIFDRSWYGRVMVERIESFCSDVEWERAYGELNEFEQQLSDHDILVLKFWLHIDQDEQLDRFRERERTPHKKHKMTEEDYRNREKWGQYVQAVNDMVALTDTGFAPWHLVSGNSKRYARVRVIETVVSGLKAHLER